MTDRTSLQQPCPGTPLIPTVAKRSGGTTFNTEQILDSANVQTCPHRFAPEKHAYRAVGRDPSGKVGMRGLHWRLHSPIEQSALVGIRLACMNRCERIRTAQHVGKRGEYSFVFRFGANRHPNVLAVQPDLVATGSNVNAMPQQQQSRNNVG